jgi:hypothetical protein
MIAPKSGSSDIRLEDPLPKPLDAPSTEVKRRNTRPNRQTPPEDGARESRCARSTAHLRRHPIVAPGRTFWSARMISGAIRSHAALLKTNRSITPRLPPKSSLEADLPLKKKPLSPHHLTRAVLRGRDSRFVLDSIQFVLGRMSDEDLRSARSVRHVQRGPLAQASLNGKLYASSGNTLDASRRSKVQPQPVSSITFPWLILSSAARTILRLLTAASMDSDRSRSS